MYLYKSVYTNNCIYITSLEDKTVLNTYYYSGIFMPFYERVAEELTGKWGEREREKEDDSSEPQVGFES